MKKLIAIAVVFILAVGVAFAADVVVDVIGAITPLKGNSKDGSTVDAYGMFNRIRIEASGQNDDGNFGGWLRFVPNNAWDGSGISGGTTYGEAVKAAGFVWWKPHDIFKLQIGVNPDGHFNVDGVAPRWGFYQVASDARVAVENWYFGESFYAGYGTPGAILTLTPLEPLEINVAIPFLTTGWGTKASEVYKQFHGQVAYNLGSIGKVALTYASNTNELDGSDYDGTPGSITSSPSKLFGYFGITAIENLDIDLGVGYTLPVKDEVMINSKKQPISVNAPVAVGLGVNFTAGALGIKARVQGEFGGSVTIAGKAEKDDTVFTADLMPTFEVTDSVKAYLSTGLRMTSYAKDGMDSKVQWHIQPYVSVKANWWAPNFYAGIRFEGTGDANKTTEWSVPIGIVFSF